MKKDEDEFWALSMRRLWALFDVRNRREERLEKERNIAKQNKALEQMRAL